MQSAIISYMEPNVSLYIHIPFCKTRCFYCDFNTFAGKDQLISDYVSALCNEITRQKPYGNSAVHSVYFGGGTPSRLAPSETGRVMAAVQESFRLMPDAEVTFEMNPCDVTADHAAALAASGINRVSLGMQSAIPEELKRMNRRHTPERTALAVEMLQNAGIQNISLDLIYGYPGQTLENWQLSLQAAVDLGAKHISLYALSVEDGSALRRQLEMGKLTLPDEELTVAMYDLAAEFLAEKGFQHYEISNWASEETYESRHNKQYWFVYPYYGFGAGAHGWIDHRRIRNTGGIEDYIREVNTSDKRFPAAAEITPQSRRVEMQDVMMLGLRMLREGITEDRFRSRFGIGIEDVFSREIKHLERKELIHRGQDGRFLLNPDKVMVANQAFIEFVD